MREPNCNKKRIFLCGFYGCGNLGDDALLLSLLRALENEKAELSYLTGGDPALARLTCSTRAAAVSRSLPDILRAVRECDAFVLGGGSLLQNATGQASLYAYLSLLRFAQKQGKKTAILAGGLGPIDGKAARLSVSSVLRRLDYASFRDAEACAFARTLGAPSPILSADPALLLSPAQCRIPLPARFLLVSLRKKSGMPAQIAARRVFCMSEAMGLTPVFCVLFPDEDRIYTQAVAREVSRLCALCGKTTAAWTLPRLSPEKLLAVTERADFILTGRYHLALFAYLSSVPFRVMGDDPKLLSISVEKRPPQETVRRAAEDIARLKALLL